MLEELSLKGKVAIVTGSGSGLGKAMALALAKAGADVVGGARRLELVEQTAREIRELGRRGVAIHCDVTDSRQVDELVEKTVAEFGKVDILVNNAGAIDAIQAKSVLEITDEDWDNDIKINLTSAFYCSRAAGKYMLRQRSGRAINICSVAGLLGMTANFVYGIAKAGLMQLTRMLAMSWARDGVNVNAIVCGPFSSREEMIPLGRFNPTGRIGKPIEICPLTVFLASEASNYITGEMFIIDGGITAGTYAPLGYIPSSTKFPLNNEEHEGI